MAKLVQKLKRELTDSSEIGESNERLLQAKADASKGIRFLKEGNYEKAVKYMTCALDLDPQLGNSTFFSNRSIAHYKLGFYLNCLEDVKRALKFDSRSLQCYQTAYKALQRMKCVDDSFAYYCKWFTLDPTLRSKFLKDGSLAKYADEAFQSSQLIDIDPALSTQTKPSFDFLAKLLAIAENLREAKKLTLCTYVYEAAIVVADWLQVVQQRTAIVLLTLAKTLQQIGDFHASLAYLSQLETLASVRDDVLMQIEALKCQGLALYKLKDFRNALVCYEKEHGLVCSRADDLKLKASSLHRLGDVCHILGDFKVAVNYLEEYLKLSRQLQDKQCLASAHFQLGKVQFVLGNFNQAAWHFRTQLNVLRKLGDDRKGQADALSHLGRTHLAMRQLDEFLKCCEQQLEIAASHVALRARSLHDLGLAHFHLKRLDSSIGYFEEARVAAQQENDKVMEAMVCSDEAMTYIGLGNFLLAVSRLKAALELSTPNPVLAMQCHERLGSLYFGAEKKYQQKAEFHLKTAVESFENLRRDFGSFDRLKQRAVEMPTSAYQKLLHLIAVVKGDAKESLAVAECYLAREYVEKLLPRQDIQIMNSFRQLPVGLLSYEDTVKLASNLDAQVLFYVYTEFGLYIWTVNRSGVGKFHHWPREAVKYLSPFLTQTHHVIATLPSGIPSRVCEQRFCLKVFTSEASDQDVGMSSSAAAAAAAATATDDDDTLPPPYSSMVSIAHRYGLSYATVGDDDLLHPSRSSYLAAPAGDGYSAVLQASMKELYDVLVGPVESHLPQLSDVGDSFSSVADLVIVPHGNLYLLPFATLVASARRVLPSGAVHQLFSSGFRPRLMPCLQKIHGRRPAAEKVASVLVVGNPLFPQTVKYFGRPWSPPSLPFAEREARHVALLLGPGFEPSVGSGPTRDAVFRQIGRASVVHLATHGSWELGAFAVSPSDPTHSNTDVTERQYLITPNDIAGLSLAAKLVVLSGFNSVLNPDLVSADSLLCTARSFLLAGAQTVVVSLWSPPDRATDEMMFALYEGMQRGLTVSEALRQGMVHIRSRRGFTDPIHWAGFIVFGDDVTVNMQEETASGVHVNVTSSSHANEASSRECTQFLHNLQLVLTADVPLSQIVALLRMVHGMLSSAVERLNQGRPNRSLHLSDVHTDLFSVSGWRELLVSLAFSFHHDLEREDDVLVFPDSSDLELLKCASACFSALLDLSEARQECLLCLASLLPLEKSTASGLKYALGHAKEKIPEDSVELFGIWAMHEPREFLESIGIHQIADNHENVLLSPSDRYSEVLASKAIVCLEAVESLHSDPMGAVSEEEDSENEEKSASSSLSTSPRLISVLENLRHDFNRKLQSGLSNSVLPKDKPNICSLCEAKFSLFRRRYHCRICDRVLCSKCYDQPPSAEEADDAAALLQVPLALRRKPGICLSCQLMFPQGSLTH